MHNPLVPREDKGLLWTKGDHLVTLRCHARGFHARGSQRHACYGQAADTFWFGLEHTLHIGDRYVPFERHPVDQGGVARGKPRWQSNPRLQCGAIAIINNPDIPAKRLAHLGCPFLTTAAAWIAVHNRVSRRQGWRRDKSQGQCKLFHFGNFQSVMRGGRKPPPARFTQ